MQRTQMYLDEKLRKDLKALAKREDKSMAEVARDILQEGVEKKRSSVDNSGIKIMLSLLDIKAKGGPKDLAVNHDHYLYGGPKKKP
ncbi:MAG: ribbon-helix-helix protein, CopG family [Candidatus Levybacteria bacterium]|nr:ribbon-helix-helix protein, CopG family [Candidatus Levybacteria bacterium]